MNHTPVTRIIVQCMIVAVLILMLLVAGAAPGDFIHAIPADAGQVAP